MTHNSSAEYNGGPLDLSGSEMTNLDIRDDPSLSRYMSFRIFLFGDYRQWAGESFFLVDEHVLR